MYQGRRSIVAGKSRPKILTSLGWQVQSKPELLGHVLEADLKSLTGRRLEDLYRSLNELDPRMEVYLEPYRHQVQLLETIPAVDLGKRLSDSRGVDPDPVAFRGRIAIGAWPEGVPRYNKGVGKYRVQRGNPTLRADLVDGVHGAVLSEGKLVQGRLGHTQALIAKADKMLRVILAPPGDNRMYHDPGFAYEKRMAKRNAPRQVRMLVKHGFLEKDCDRDDHVQAGGTGKEWPPSRDRTAEKAMNRGCPHRTFT